MANTKSAKKAVRQIAKRTEINKTRRTQLRSHVRQVEEAIAAGDAEAATEALRSAQPVIAKVGQAGVIHRNTASRKISRLSARVKALSGAQA
ncbi:MAG: 30S ribosomal protein S20 [Pseudomonadota bacterium]